MKKLLLVFWLFALGMSAKTVKITNITNNNNIRWKIQAAIDAVGTVDGDVIRIPAGKWIIDSNIRVTKKVTVEGEGIGKTFFYRRESTSDATLQGAVWGSVLTYSIGATTSSNILVRGITFQGQIPADSTGDGGSLATDRGLDMINVKDFRINNCQFKWFGVSGVRVVHDDSIAGGLIDYCNFKKNVKLWKTTGLGFGYGVEVYGTNVRYVWDSDPGSSRFIFIEKCTFDLHRHHIAGGGGAKYVARYSIFINGYGGPKGTHLIDGHDPRGDGNTDGKFATRCIEFYHNYVYNEMAGNGRPWTSGDEDDLRESVFRTYGEFVFHHNYMKGFRFGVGMGRATTTTFTLTGYPYGSGSAVGHTGAWAYPADYPATLQTGYLSARKYGTSDNSTSGDHIDDDAFIWSNTWVSMDNNVNSILFYNYGNSNVTGFFVQGRDYHLIQRPNYTEYAYPHPLSVSIN